MAAASAVGGAAKWIGASLVEEGKYLYGIEDHVKALQSDLECIQILLQRVDGNSHRVLEADGQFRIFTKKIRELAFRAEDVIDTYVIDVGSKVYRKNLFSKLACLVSHCYPVHMLRNEIEAIQQEIEDAKMRFHSFGINMPATSSHHQQGNIVGSSSSQPIPENYIHLDDEVIVGINDVISQLAKRLTNLEDDFKVVGIVGTGGAGKTTLATQLYRHSKVASWFPHKAFVPISQQWSRSDLFIRIFKQVKGEDSRVPSSEAEIVRDLHDFLKDKQCLIVLDDMWKMEAWDDIYPIFPHANKGCRIILTTRIKEVVLHSDNKCIIHEPDMLTKDQKWELFSKVAMKGRSHIEKNVEFEKLGKLMLGKCEGIPLVVVALAGILRTKQELYQWEEISLACTSNILKGKGGHKYGVVEDMLELSYLELPTHLKKCLLYMACFPEDYEIGAEMLIQMWIAEGFFMDDKQARRGILEAEARQSLDELAQHCIIQVTLRSALGQIKNFRLHDLMRELCMKYAKESQFFGTINASTNDSNVGGSSQPRRMSIYLRDVDIDNHQLRTLVHFGLQPDRVLTTLESIHHKFKLLRVLHIEKVDIVALPKQIGDLIHLRYLAIYDTKIKELPKSIMNLRNLLYLKWNDYGEPLTVPNGLVCNMENLRGLELPLRIKRGPRLESLGLCGSNNLQTLWVGAGKWMTKDLPALSRTVRNLYIHKIQEMEEMEAIYGCPSIVEDRLSSLTCRNVLSGEAHVEFDLRKLSHCTTLRELNLGCPLTINCTGTIQCFPPNLVELTLSDSRIERDDLMQVIGELPKLKSLRLFNDAYLGTQLSCSAGSAIPQLQELYLSDLRNLEEWRLEEGAMPHLSKIRINYCVKLKRLPESIRSITILKELHIEFMPEEFCRRLGYGSGESSLGGEDSYIIQHIPTVKFECLLRE